MASHKLNSISFRLATDLKKHARRSNLRHRIGVRYRSPAWIISKKRHGFLLEIGDEYKSNNYESE
jgi:hypothetical protein